MLAISITVNVLWIVLSVAFSFVAGFIFRSNQIHKLKKQVGSLEKEMLTNHAEILSLHEELVRVQSKNTNPKTLVVAMKDVAPAEDANEKIAETRKIK
jgi:hypothetical protein